MDPSTELFQLAETLSQAIEEAARPEFKAPLEQLQLASEKIGQAWSRSWLGYHARVYYRNLVPPPPNAHFSVEWGLIDTMHRNESTGDWEKYEPEIVRQAVRELAGDPDISGPRQIATHAAEVSPK